MKLSSTKILLGALLGSVSLISAAEPYKVLVVMSYEEDNPWCMEIRQGIDSVLGANSEVTYFYMDTKVNREGGPAKAEQAYALFKAQQPDGVITVDDNAQSMFVVPSLTGTTDVPVMFAGVNSPAEKYGYPNHHVSGILERAHVRESLAFAKQLMPEIKTACFMTNDVPSGRALRQQVLNEQSSYPVEAGAFYLVRESDQFISLESELNRNCDTLFVDSLEGIKDSSGQSLRFSQVMQQLTAAYDGPVLAGNRYQVEQGAWAAVVKTGQEQGETAAQMLHQAMNGTPVSDIPVVTNTRGERIVNVTALDQNQVPLKPLALRGATLVRQQSE